MTARLDTHPPRGMRDLLPDEVEVRDRATATILDVYRRHGFQRIETPAVESIKLLTRSEGGENEKLIFKILKRGEKLVAGQDVEDLVDLGLRFDLTVPLARYYANNHGRLPHPLKAIQIGPVWRAERPQAGRFRQFTQCDIDILGVASETAEIELIIATAEALLALGLTDLTVRLNDRRILAAVARHCGFEEARFDSVFIALDKLDKIEKAGMIGELEAEGHPAKAIGGLLALLDEVTDTAWRLDRLAPLLREHWDPGVGRALERILGEVQHYGRGEFQIRFDPTLVRGMGYYTGPIFEVQYRQARSSIAGGGRYDRMIGRLLGRDVPATGFSIGFERVIGILMEEATPAAHDRERVALVFDEQAATLTPALRLARELREQGSIVSLEIKSKKAGRQLQELELRGFGRIGVVGEDGAVEWRVRRSQPVSGSGT
ncbi:MAG TPA: histidine--tRNA ligase [Methylomirabilota bacterium]|nr:histidine--tRNA ligase [Methylomirabilota bacterium]